jgi:hypothetical protein
MRRRILGLALSWSPPRSRSRGLVVSLAFGAVFWLVTPAVLLARRVHRRRPAGPHPPG